MALNKDSLEKKDLEYIHQKAAEEFEILGGSTLLFTGANGFLGYYFIKSILYWNYKYPNKKIIVYALDKFDKGVPEWLQKRTDVKILKKDVTKYKLPKDLSFDYIIHAASIASPIFYRMYPIETIDANIGGLYNILNYMLKRQKTKKGVKGDSSS